MPNALGHMRRCDALRLLRRGGGGHQEPHPPKCLIRKPYPANLLTVPSCEECNNSSSEDEEYFRLVMVGLLCHTDEAELLFDGPISRSMDRNSNIEELMFGALRGADKTVILDVDYPRIIRIAEKIARGLEFITTGVPFPVDQQFEIDFAEVEGTSSVAPYGSDFTCRRLAEEQGRWEFTLFESVRFVVEPA